MQLSDKRIKALQVLLKEQTGRDYNSKELQKAALAIMRFVIAKHKRSKELNQKKESSNE